MIPIRQRIIESSLIFILILIVAGIAAGSYGTVQTSTANYVLGQAGFQDSFFGVTDHQFYAPSAVAKDSAGDVWIADYENHRVLKFEYLHEGTYLYSDTAADLVIGQAHYVTRYSGTGDTQLNHPTALAFDDSGNLFVADAGNNRIVRFNADSDGIVRDTAADFFLGAGRNGSDSYSNIAGTSDTMLSNPVALAIDDSGNLYIGEAGNHRIVRFDASNTRVIVNDTADFIIGHPGFSQSSGGCSEAMLSIPRALAFDIYWNLYVADDGNTRVLRFDANIASSRLLTDTTADWVIGQAGFGPGVSGTSDTMIRRPMGLAFERGNQSLFVSDSDNFRVLRFDCGGTGVIYDTQSHFVIGHTNFALTNSGTGDTQLNGPAAIAIGPNDRLHVCDVNNNRVLIYNSRPIIVYPHDPEELDCFVATAAMGRQSPRVDVMRDFRDHQLLNSRLGRSICASYYGWGPHAAGWIGERPYVRLLVRPVILPLAGFSYLGEVFGVVSFFFVILIVLIAPRGIRYLHKQIKAEYETH